MVCVSVCVYAEEMRISGYTEGLNWRGKQWEKRMNRVGEESRYTYLYAYLYGDDFFMESWLMSTTVDKFYRYFAFYCFLSVVRYILQARRNRDFFKTRTFFFNRCLGQLACISINPIELLAHSYPEHDSPVPKCR